MKKQQKHKKSLRLEKQVLVQLDASGLQRVAGGLSFHADCGTAFICGTQVCPE